MKHSGVFELHQSRPGGRSPGSLSSSPHLLQPFNDLQAGREPTGGFLERVDPKRFDLKSNGPEDLSRMVPRAPRPQSSARTRRRTENQESPDRGGGASQTQYLQYVYPTGTAHGPSRHPRRTFGKVSLDRLDGPISADFSGSPLCKELTPTVGGDRTKGGRRSLEGTEGERGVDRAAKAARIRWAWVVCKRDERKDGGPSPSGEGPHPSGLKPRGDQR